jgi:hypothetical protein
MALSVALSLFALAASPQLCGIADAHCQADYAADAHALRLAPQSADHVRVFRSVGLSDSSVAWVLLAPASAAEARGNELLIVHDSAAFVAFSALASLDGKHVACGVKDGVYYIVDSFVEGRRVTFTASNPARCSAPEASAISAALNLLPEPAEGEI